MSISDSCKAYERYHNTHYQDDPFPISKSKLIRYIKFRARCSTFPEFLTNLDQHPEHGPHWLEEMNSDPDIRKLMDLTINLWPRIAKQCKLPLIGIGNVYETPSFEQKYGKYIRDKVNQEVMYRERVHVVEGKKSKGFMVTDPTQTRLEDTGTSSDSPINLDHPTPIQRFKSTKTSNSPSTASKYTPSTKYAASSTSTATTTTTTANKSTSKYDPKLDAIAIRDELMQQMMMPDQMRLVSRFKASATTKAPSKPPSPSVRSVSPSSPPPAPPSSSSSSSKTPKKEKQRAAPPSEPTVKSTSSTKNKPAATKKETTTTTQKKPPVIQKKNPPVNKKSAEKDLWKQAQKVNVRIEKPQDEEEDTVPHQPVVKIVKKKPLHYGTNDDIAPPPPPPPPARNSSTDHIKIRHPVVLIKKAPPRRKDPVVKSIEKTPVPYPQQTQDEDEKQDQKRRVKEEKEEEQEQDQHDDNSHRNKRKKRDDYLYDQNRLQIVQIVIENHASSPSVIVPVKKSGL